MTFYASLLRYIPFLTNDRPGVNGYVFCRRSQVQSLLMKSGFRVTFLSLSLVVGYQVLDETSNGSTGTSGMIIHILKLSIRNVLLIQRHFPSELKNQRFRLDVNPEPLI